MIETDARITTAELQHMAIHHVPLAGKLGFCVTSATYGHATVLAGYQTDFVRPGGTISGPVMMALADFAMYCALLGAIGRVELAVTTSLNINFLHRPKPGTLYAEARLIKLGRRLAVGEVHIYDETGQQTVAHATLTYSIPPGHAP